MRAAISGQSGGPSPRLLSDDHKDALIAEVLGDVLSLHQSVKDLVAITNDADKRITSRVSELRALVADLAGMREALLAELAVRSGDEAKRALRDSFVAIDQRLVDAVRQVDRRPMLGARRQWADRAAVAIMTAAISSCTTLGGIAVLLHLH